jgi:torulene dioxygenase
MEAQPHKVRSMISHGLDNIAEQPDPIKLDVHGQIPSWLSGALYRTGPGTFSVPTEHGHEWKPAHWFDGLGLHHKFDIKPNGEVWYRNRKAGPKSESSIMKNGTRILFGFGPSDPCETFFQKFTTFFKHAIGILPYDRAEEGGPSVTLTPNMPGFAVPSSHTASKVNGVEYLVAKTDGNILSILDPETLQVLAPVDYGDLNPALKGAAPSAAHACTDPISRDMFNYVYKFGKSAGYSAFRIRGRGPDRGNLTVLAKITDAPPAYLHSSCLTEKYFILCVWQADIKWYVFPRSSLIDPPNQM